MKKVNEKGFTLAELLIVVAIIAVMVAIAIPSFNGYIEKSREATDAANIQSAASEVMVEFADSNGTEDITKTVTLQQGMDGWTSGSEYAKNLMTLFTGGGAYLQPPHQGTATITCDHLTGLLGLSYKDSAATPQDVTAFDSTVIDNKITIAEGSTAPTKTFDKTSGTFSLDLTKYTTKIGSADAADIAHTDGQIISVKPGSCTNIKSVSIVYIPGTTSTYAIKGVADINESTAKLTIVVMKSDGSAGELEVELSKST